MKTRTAGQREVTVKLPTLHPAQQQIRREARRFNVMCCGRRFGKNVLLQDVAIRAALAGQPVGWFAPSYKMQVEDWRAVTERLKSVTKSANASDMRLELVTGGVIQFWSLVNPDTARGRKFKRVVINEAAMVDDLHYTWTAVIRSTLIDLEGDAWFASTPKGLNEFYRLWVAAGETDHWRRWHYTSRANPHIKPAEIDAIKAELPARVARQEIDAEFLEDGAFFQGVDRAAVLMDRSTPEAHRGHSVYGGLDWAMTEDWTVLTLACQECGRVVDWDRFNQIDYTYQRARIIEMCKRWDVAGLMPERNSIGQPNIELLREHVHVLAGPDRMFGFNTSATTKPQLIQRLAAAIEHDGFLVPAEYADELRSYQVSVGESGHAKFGAPDGAHDDRVISLALSLWAITSGWVI